MKTLSLCLFALALIVARYTVLSSEEAQFFKGTVTSIYDASKFSVTLSDESKVSVTLFATVAPERSTESGANSREFLKKLIYKKNITIEIVEEETEEKVSGIAYLEGGENINEILLRNGHVFFDLYSTYINREKYLKLEQNAKEAKFGMWALPSIELPESLKPLIILKKFIGTVSSVYDGDTLTVQRANGQRDTVRFYAIDSPERDQASGIQARDFLRSIVLSNRVSIEVVDIDRYGRNVGIVKTSTGVNVNEEMIKNGWAWHYKDYSKLPNFQELEDQAREKKIGLWGLPEPPVAPWEYRNGGSKSLEGPSKPKHKSGLLASDPNIEVFEGVVNSVSDGDTFVIYTKGDSRRVRMYGIDAPEKNQLGGDLAKEFAQALLQGEKVTVQVKSKDQYDRSVGLLIMPNGEIYNEKALKKGFAWHYKSYSDDESYAEFEQEARKKGLGIWGLDGVNIAPWDWRNGVSSYTGGK